MPEKASVRTLFAPCGNELLVCYRHRYHKKPKVAAWKGNRKPEHCRACKNKIRIKKKDYLTVSNALNIHATHRLLNLERI